MVLTLDSVLCRKKSLLDTTVDDEIVLLSMENSMYYGMDRIASRIWCLLHKPTKIEFIVNVIEEEYDICREDCEKDVMAFLSHLIEEGLVK